MLFHFLKWAHGGRVKTQLGVPATCRKMSLTEGEHADVSN